MSHWTILIFWLKVLLMATHKLWKKHLIWWTSLLDLPKDKLFIIIYSELWDLLSESLIINCKWNRKYCLWTSSHPYIPRDSIFKSIAIKYCLFASDCLRNSKLRNKWFNVLPISSKIYLFTRMIKINSCWPLLVE
jgi:hypothetical protein